MQTKVNQELKEDRLNTLVLEIIIQHSIKIPLILKKIISLPLFLI